MMIEREMFSEAPHIYKSHGISVARTGSSSTTEMSRLDGMAQTWVGVACALAAATAEEPQLQ